MELTERHLDMLRHMLGINDRFWKRDPECYRDYAAVNPGDPLFVDLESLGAVHCYKRAEPGRTKYDWFCCTPEGKEAALASFMKLRYRKSRRVYHRFLDLKDCWADLTFHQFLTDPQFTATRRKA